MNNNFLTLPNDSTTTSNFKTDIDSTVEIRISKDNTTLFSEENINGADFKDYSGENFIFHTNFTLTKYSNNLRLEGIISKRLSENLLMTIEMDDSDDSELILKSIIAMFDDYKDIALKVFVKRLSNIKEANSLSNFLIDSSSIDVNTYSKDMLKILFSSLLDYPSSKIRYAAILALSNILDEGLYEQTFYPLLKKEKNSIIESLLKGILNR